MKAGTLSGLRAGIVLPAFFSCFFLISCSRPLEKSYDVNAGLARMSSVGSHQSVSVHASGFSSGLALPGNTEFNSGGLKSSESFLLLSADSVGESEVLSYRKPYQRVYPASITKLMTALVCLESGVDLDSEFTITKSSSISVSGSSTAFLWEGESLRIKDLLYGMLLPSGNDASVAVAEATSGSVPEFVRAMNQKALELGCTGTHFVNPHGLPDDEHYTTAYDIYLILSAALKHEEFREIVGSPNYEVHYKDRNGIAKKQSWQVSNRYMTGEAETPLGLKILGGKTGTTKKAGYCLAQAVEKEGSGRSYIAVVMKTESRDMLYSDMTELLGKIS